MPTPQTTIYLILAIIQILPYLVLGHGRLEDPPSRSTMWRFGFDNPQNYNDHELYCGGLSRQIRNGGKCGVCGDPWDSPVPRPNEDGGKYGRGIVVKRYNVGQVIDVTVDITANHNGYFEFKLCPVRKNSVVDDSCMDQYSLQLADGSGYRYYLPRSQNEKFPVKLVLPKGLTCSRCVFQWTYTAGNNWGTCKDGTGKVGCGPQETFRACADIAIGEETNEIGWNDIKNTVNTVSNGVFIEGNEVGASGASKSKWLKNGVVVLLLIALIFVLVM